MPSGRAHGRDGGGNFQGYTYQYEDAAGVVHTIPVTIYDPTTGRPLSERHRSPNKIASSNDLDEAATYLGTSRRRRHISAPCQQFLLCDCELPYSTRAPSTGRALLSRGDYNMSVKSQFSFRYSSGNEGKLSAGLLGAGSKTYHPVLPVHGILYLYLLPYVVNEFRFGFSHFYNSLAPLQSFTKDVVDGLGIPGLTGRAPGRMGHSVHEFC